MSKLSKRAIPILIMITIALSMIPLMTVSAAIGFVSVWNDEDEAYQDWGNYDDLIIVMGDGVTAGEEVQLGWDGLQAWDGEKGILNSTDADGAGDWEIWFDVPEATAGNHYLWVKDTDTGDTLRYANPFVMVPSLDFDPSSGLFDEKITVDGYGFGEEVDIEYLEWDTTGYTPTNITMTPATPETDELGTWEATFKVPTAVYATYDIEVGDEDGNRIIDDFTVGASIEFDIDEGPVGTYVEISGKGFTNLVTIDYGDVKILGEGTLCEVTDTDVVDNGEFDIEIVIPYVSKEEEEYDIQVSDGTNSAAEEFEVLGLAEIEAEPEFGVQGASIEISAWNFTQESGEDVFLELWIDIDDDDFINAAVDDYVTDIDDYETESDGEFIGTFTVPARSSDVYALVAIQPDYNINASTEFRIGMMIVIPSPDTGPSGASVTLTGTGFTDGGEWNATLGPETIFEDGDVDADGNLDYGGIPEFFVPTLDPGTYTITVMDIDTEITVDTEFTVTERTYIETDPVVAPNDYNVTIMGKYFSEEEFTDIEFVLYNVTADGKTDEEWDLTVKTNQKTGPGGATVTETDEDGNVTGWWEVFDDETLSLGEYILNATDDNDIYAQYTFNVVSETVDIEPRKTSFDIGNAISFKIESSFAQDDSYIKIWDPEGELVFQTDEFDEQDDDWLKVGEIRIVPYYRQTAGGNPMILAEDAALGTYTWTWYDDDDDELDSGSFSVAPAPADILAGQVEALAGTVEALSGDMSALSSSVAAIAGDVGDLASDVAAAVSAANAAASAVDDLASTVADIADIASTAAQAAENAATAASSAQTAAEDAGRAASGLTTLVYGAIGASLVAALAAIVALMQISRRIAG